MDLKLDNLITLALFSGIFIWKREIKGLFHVTLEKFQNENFTPKTYQMFPVHVTPEIFENANSVFFFVDTNWRKAGRRVKVNLVWGAFSKSSVFGG